MPQHDLPDYVRQVQSEITSNMVMRCLQCGLDHRVGDTCAKAVSQQLAAARAEIEALRGERDEAVAEAARRDQKWMDGIDTICGIKLNYQSPFVDGGVSLDQFISALTERANSAEAERGALSLALGECVEALREIADPIAYMRKRAEEQGLSLNGMMTVRIAEDHNYLKAIAIKALASPLAARSSERWAKMREVVDEAKAANSLIEGVLKDDDRGLTMDECAIAGRLLLAIDALDAQEVNGE